jgi:hypothetical protein
VKERRRTGDEKITFNLSILVSSQVQKRVTDYDADLHNKFKGFRPPTAVISLNLILQMKREWK